MIEYEWHMNELYHISDIKIVVNLANKTKLEDLYRFQI